MRRRGNDRSAVTVTAVSAGRRPFVLFRRGYSLRVACQLRRVAFKHRMWPALIAICRPHIRYMIASGTE
jgi:hypothetical protein